MGCWISADPGVKIYLEDINPRGVCGEVMLSHPFGLANLRSLAIILKMSGMQAPCLLANQNNCY